MNELIEDVLSKTRLALNNMDIYKKGYPAGEMQGQIQWEQLTGKKREKEMTKAKKKKKVKVVECPRCGEILEPYWKACPICRTRL